VATKLATVLADFTTQLATAMAVGATTASLQSATDDDGNALPSGTYFFALDGNNSQKEHIVATLSGTSLTAISSVSRQGVQASGVVRSHRVGSTVTLTDFAHLRYINDLVSGATTFNASVPLGYDGTATISTANQFATKAYVDGVAVAGGADASTTVKGINKMSVAPASPTAPIAVGDNDGRVPTQAENDALVGTSGTAVSSSNKLVDAADVSSAAASGKIVRASGTALPALDGSALTGNPALNGANFTNVAPPSFVAGVLTDLATTTAGNNDVTITTTFTPRLIRLKYWIQGHTPGGGTNVFNSTKGEAIYNATTLVSNNVQYTYLSGADNTAPNFSSIGGSATFTFFITPSSTTAPAVGDIASANGGIVVTLSIASVSSTTLVIRRATTVNGTGGQARASISYEAFA
jgi:hypothetical protein